MAGRPKRRARQNPYGDEASFWQDDECVRFRAIAEFDGGEGYLWVTLEQEGPYWGVKAQWGKPTYPNHYTLEGSTSWALLSKTHDLSPARAKKLAWAWGVQQAQDAGFMDSYPQFMA
jgi:hypothetical protein